MLAVATPAPAGSASGASAPDSPRIARRQRRIPLFRHHGAPARRPGCGRGRRMAARPRQPTHRRPIPQPRRRPPQDGATAAGGQKDDDKAIAEAPADAAPTLAQQALAMAAMAMQLQAGQANGAQARARTRRRPRRALRTPPASAPPRRPVPAPGSSAAAGQALIASAAACRRDAGRCAVRRYGYGRHEARRTWPLSPSDRRAGHGRPDAG